LPVRYALYACAGHTASLYALLALSLLLAALTVTLFCLRAPQRWKGTLA
jgi:hypothetical protein